MHSAAWYSVWGRMSTERAGDPAGWAASPPELSVVLASVTGGPAIHASVARLREACEGIPSELIIVAARAPASPPPEWTEANARDVRNEALPKGTLTPILWAAGLRLARAHWVAFTTDQMRVTPSWAQALLQALESGAWGAGGPIDLAPDADATTAAGYLIRFSSFTPHGWPEVARARDVPGDNAVYRRDMLLRHPDLVREGFWEIEFHRRLERDGGFLLMVPNAAALLVGPVPFGALLRQRYRHARDFGGSRVRRHGESRLKLLLAAPLVPFVLLARIGGRVLKGSRERGFFLKAWPPLALLALAWAAGEAAGAVRPQPEAPNG